jgi:hypothetical protein
MSWNPPVFRDVDDPSHVMVSFEFDAVCVAGREDVEDEDAFLHGRAEPGVIAR